MYHKTVIPEWHPFASQIWLGTCDAGQLTREGLEDAVKHGQVCSLTSFRPTCNRRHRTFGLSIMTRLGSCKLWIPETFTFERPPKSVRTRSRVRSCMVWTQAQLGEGGRYILSLKMFVCFRPVFFFFFFRSTLTVLFTFVPLPPSFSLKKDRLVSPQLWLSERRRYPYSISIRACVDRSSRPVSGSSTKIG